MWFIIFFIENFNFRMWGHDIEYTHPLTLVMLPTKTASSSKRSQVNHGILLEDLCPLSLFRLHVRTHLGLCRCVLSMPPRAARIKRPNHLQPSSWADPCSSHPSVTNTTRPRHVPARWEVFIAAVVGTTLL